MGRKKVVIAVKPAEVEDIDECLYDDIARCLDLCYSHSYDCMICLYISD